jgi:cyclopropane-fatty-acyl-phospholipid synthase
MKTLPHQWIFALVAVGAIAASGFRNSQWIWERLVRAALVRSGVPDKIYDHMNVTNEAAWYDIAVKGSLGIGEAYMSGDVQLDLYPFFRTLLDGTSAGTLTGMQEDSLAWAAWAVQLPGNVYHMLTDPDAALATSRIQQHYDVGNDLYEAMLGPSMSYTCAYYQGGAENLTAAQVAKFDLIRRKLQLDPGMQVLDIGFGFGSAAAYIQEKSKVTVTGITVSAEQRKYAEEHHTSPHLKFMHEDWRDHCSKHSAKYDRIYIVGVLEHFGSHNYPKFFECTRKMLKPDGLLLIHTIGQPFMEKSGPDPFLDKYIFPGGELPTLHGLSLAFRKHFLLEDFQNFGFDYSTTLASWHDNADKFFASNSRYSLSFQRMWTFYLSMCSVLFETRITQLWHFVLTPRPALRRNITRQL